jgi:hypothetical protein
VEELIKTDVVQVIAVEEEKQVFANTMPSGLFYLAMTRENMVLNVQKRL